MEDPIVLACGNCYHELGHPELPFHTASMGTPHICHWPIPKSVAEERGYRKCKICYELPFEAVDEGKSDVSGIGAFC